MNNLTLYNDDNLTVLHQLKESGQKFDLVELDGPYMAGLEDWDNMTEAEYIQHYAERLTLVRDVLKPWGVVFVFGYPEGCAEIKSWAHRTETLYLRRWIHWYKPLSVHKGRRIENILLFWRDTPSAAAVAWGKFLKEERLKRNWTLRDVGEMANRQWWHRGGNLYYENGNGGFPSVDDITVLSQIFEFSVNDWPGLIYESYEGLTDFDLFCKGYNENNIKLSGDRLKSKPVGLYLDLFRPTIPPTEGHDALVLYGGSGNAGIAAACLNYNVVMCETNEKRVESIQATMG